ncbi:SEC10/PgrA surface exclusion domain-containing protein [Streptococcus oralis]|uniref:SEC10/PgrA surface exclusion domain-containing protein n=1 Tax=Streptococcus oralis TaxID=1303 RepID=UPI0022844594|nr:SEC10/PgrA surface exclusion domain-containing protein [Streptococcus oralis]MCY7077395.1 SEC10/PgrA surface exclusion domain-containing protein [Streptococcus oralis]
MSKTTENSHSTTKKLYTGAVISAIAATGLVSTIGTAHADTVEFPLPTTAKNEPALVEKEAPKKVEVKTPTKEEVAELGATAKQTQADADKAKEVLDQANEKSDKAEKKVADLKQAQADAQKTADKATPEAIKDAEKKVETAKANVPTKEQAVSTAQAEKDDADREVAVHGKTVGTKQASVTQARNQVATAKTEVENAQKALNGEGLADAKKAQASAIKEESESKQAQEMAQKVLDEAKSQNQNHTAQLKRAEQTVQSAQATLEAESQEKETAKTNADQANTTYNQAVSTLNALQKEDTRATITLAPDFIKAVKEKIAFKHEIRTNGDKLSEEYLDSKSDELYDRIVNTQLQNRTLNKYTPSAKDQADETRYDINNLPKEVTDELNYFVADLINQMRRQLGLPDVVLSKSSLEFANKIAKEYVKADWSHAMIDEYRAKGGAGHYAKGVYKAASEYGLKSGYSEAKDKEYMEKGFQPYENSVTNPFYHDFDDEDGVYRKTIGEMKEKLYDDLIELVSHKNDYLHTQGILQFDYADEVVYFGGVAQSKSNEIYTTHFITSLRSSHVDGSKWDTTPIVNPLSNTNKEQELAKARQVLADAMVARKNAQDKLEATSKAVSDAQTALQNAQATLKALNNGESPLANAQKAFDEAKERHDNAVVTLANANALVNNLTASKATKEETLKQAQATLKDAEKALQTAQDTLKAEEDKMAELEAIASNKAQAVSTAKKALQDVKDQVKQAEKELADLKGAKARLVELKAELERAEAELKDAYKAQNKAKVDYEVKSLAADRAKTTYETAKAKYEEAETKRLVALADAKRKELEKAGYQPVPVVDGKGNVVDYKAEKVTVGTTGDKTYQAPAQATNAKAEPKKQLPNTGTKESNLLAVLGASLGLLALVGKRKYNR